MSRLSLSRWLWAGAAACLLAGSTCLTVALCCVFEIVGGQCEPWLLGPLVAWPLGIGLALIARAASPSRNEPPESLVSGGCADREEA